MDNETKKRKLEKLRDKMSGDPQEISRIVERLDGLNARMLELARLLEKRASVQVENLNDIRFPSSFSIQNIKDFPTTLSILNFPDTQKVAMDKPDWWQDPQAFPQKIAIDWENAPRQKQDKPDWIDSIVSIALTSISTILAKLWTTPLQTERTEQDRLKPQMMILLDGKTGKPLAKEDLRPLVNVEQRMPPSGASSGGGVGSDVNVTDRAARLLGIVYGNLAQLQQRATSNELLTWDKNLEAVLGTASLVNAGRLKTEAQQMGTWTVQAAQSGAWSVSISGTVDVGDRAARLLGVIYGSQGQQVKQTATNFNLATELYAGATAYDARQIRALTSADVVTANQGGAWSVGITGSIDVSDRAARLLGVVYGSQAQQLSQKAATFELNTYDTNLATVLGTVSLIASGRLKVDGSGVTQPISAASLPLPTGAATETTLAALAGDLGDQADAEAIGSGSLIAITKRLRTLLNGGLPAALVGGRLDVSVGNSPTVTDGGSGKTLKTQSFSLSATGTVISAVASKRLKIYAIKLNCSAALTVNWRDGATTALEGAQAYAANGGYTESVQPPAFLLATTAGNSLDLVISGTGTAAGRVTYWDDDTA